MPWFDGWDQPPGLKVKYEVTDRTRDEKRRQSCGQRTCGTRGSGVRGGIERETDEPPPFLSSTHTGLQVPSDTGILIYLGL